jgi:tripartite-type tricarboxylate transporter receptor subunit TctC
LLEGGSHEQKTFLSGMDYHWAFLISGVAFPAAPFYEGKTIRIIVGYSAGGGYDMYARVLSRHMAGTYCQRKTFCSPCPG